MFKFILIYTGLLGWSIWRAYREERRGRAPLVKRSPPETKEELPREEEPQNNNNSNKQNFNCVTWCGRTGATLKEENI